MKININKIIDVLQERELYVSSNISDELLLLEEVTIDSREIKSNDVFIAIEGFEQDGHEYISKAIELGASLIIHSKDVEIQQNSILVNDSRKAGALIASELHGNPSSKLKLIGITGTNGKTTTSTIIFDILNKMNIKCGIIGTLGYSFGDETYPLARTTPDITELNRILAKMVDNKCQVVVMEVSSHSLILDRVYGQTFDAVGFTNLTQDHLDFHNTIENYFLAKKILFDSAEADGAFAVINLDDEFGQRYFSHYNNKKISYGLNPRNDVFASDIENTPNSTKFSFHYGNKVEEILTNYIGEFNIYNLMLALTICQELFPDLMFNKELMSSLKRTNGRLEPIMTKAKGQVFLDYAHTPDAIEQVLRTLRKTNPQRLITLVGCGGDRDKAKRSPMGKIATKFSDLVIITDDNPRWENRNLIIADMLSELSAENYIVIRDRKEAIFTALDFSNPGDVVVILGKGHETYQDIKGEKLHFSDAEVAFNYQQKEETIDHKLAISYDVINLVDLKNKAYEAYNRDEFTHIPANIIKHISTDSRTIRENSLFIAIKGENFDGNDYIHDLLKNNPTCFAIGEINFDSERYLKVDDALHFYGYLAKRYLSLFNMKKIAITGSTGKTTTKEIITNILLENHAVLKTLGNENNYIGLPRTIFRARLNDQYGVFEIGTNSFGEINYLSNIIQPHIAVITSVDSAHLEKLASVEGVFKEKTSLFNRKLEKFIFPGDDELFSNYKSQEYRNIGYAVGKNSDNNFVYEVADITNEIMKLKVNNSQYEVNNQIPYFGLNYAIAVSLAKLLEINLNDLIYGLQKKLDISHRMNIINKNKQIIIADCYNANPKSTSESIKFWSELRPELEHIAVLGDMLELGETAEELHLDIKKILKKLTNIKVYTVGKLSQVYDSDCHFATVDAFIDSTYMTELSEGVILLKGSHGIHLEKILELI